MRKRVLRRPIVFLRVRCRILIFFIKTVRCSNVRCSIVRCSIVRYSIPHYVMRCFRNTYRRVERHLELSLSVGWKTSYGLLTCVSVGAADSGLRAETCRSNCAAFCVVVAAISFSLQLSAVVDGVYSEHSHTAGTFTMLSSSRVYVGGSQNTHALPGSRIHSNFVGCLRKVK